MRFLGSDTDKAQGKAHTPTRHESAEKREQGRNCRRAVDPRMPAGLALHMPSEWRASWAGPTLSAGSGRRRVELGEQQGRDRCHERDLATGFTGFTSSSASLGLTASRGSAARLADWVFRIRVRSFTHGFARCGGLLVRPGLSEQSSRQAATAHQATGGNCAQSGPQHQLLQEPADGESLKLKEIKHLQHTTGAAHYSALPRAAWGVFPALIS